MGTLNQIELQNLRHFIGAQSNSYAKFTHYADSAVDPQIKQVLNKAAQDALNSKQKLMSFLVYEVKWKKKRLLMTYYQQQNLV